MYRSPKEQMASMSEEQLLAGRPDEALIMQSPGMMDCEISGVFSSVNEQLKRTMIKPFR